MTEEKEKIISLVESEENQLTDDGEGVIQESSGKKVELSKEWVLEEINNAKTEALKNAKEEAEKAIREQVQTDKASLITVFGIFASVVSFLTIEFQFLKTLCSFEKVLGFTLLLFALLFGFNVALDYLIKSRTSKETPKLDNYFLALVVIVFIFGIFFSLKGNEEICTENKIYQKYYTDFNNKTDGFYNQYDKKIKNINLRIDKLEKNNINK
jgi:hypothetical protein